MRAALVVIACTLVGLLAGLIAHFPASHALAWVAPPSVSAQGVRGTVWDGRVEQLDYGAPEPIAAVSWRLAPRHLLRGRIGFDTRFDIAGGRTTLQLGVTHQGAITIRNAKFRGPAAGVIPLLALPVDVGIDGKLLAQIDRARWIDGQPRDVQGRVLWDNARVQGPVSASFGNVITEIQPRPDGGHRLTLENRQSPLAIDGEAEADAQGRYELQLRFRPGNDTGAEVTDLLRTFARREDDAFVVRSSGRLPWR